MPIYAFTCRACGHAFDRLQKLSDPDPSCCPACGKPGPSRQLTAPSFRLAGSGWYETDFKKDGDKKRNLAGETGNTSGADSGAAAAPAATTAVPAPAVAGAAAARAPAAGND
ncbi:MAG: zinc ribbon domain-containing protein [Xanthomonadaceae bacterium]|nr:zinc ribbon domain-containing protein [Xanthomonadaceae bacterium]